MKQTQCRVLETGAVLYKPPWRICSREQPGPPGRSVQSGQPCDKGQVPWLDQTLSVSYVLSRGKSNQAPLSKKMDHVHMFEFNCPNLNVSKQNVCYLSCSQLSNSVTFECHTQQYTWQSEKTLWGVKENVAFYFLLPGIF